MLMVFVVLGVFLFLIVNTGLTLFRCLQAVNGELHPLVFTLFFTAVVLGSFFLFALNRNASDRTSRIFLKLGHYAVGFVLCAMAVFNLVSLLLLLSHLSLPPLSVVKRTAWPLVLGVVLLLALYLGGIWQGARIRTVSYEVSLGASPGKGEKLKIALISDLHLGYIVEEARLSRIVSAVNETEPDIVCIAGDIFDGDMNSLSDKAALQDILRSLRSRLGVYACLGNHDAGRGYQEMPAFLEDAGVRVLRDEGQIIDGSVVMAGRRDPSPIGRHEGDREPLTLPAGAEGLPCIILDHQPGYIGEYTGAQELILCGHTHRGQIFPGRLVTGALFTVDYGYYRAPDTGVQVIVTSGAGTWGPPLRLGTQSEVAEITVWIP